ncbi:GNAT family N-acetyltransferase [Lacimicrobium alkaliphilum]|uniref:Acetyltransferase n=1 Tax=Lacimicrobium alkaliphilum TaxID=1526571 RepID=A0A0U3AJU9_9ALTE|nr:GNAT family N-acetyltransferase [Lacimicrobium alkaliphilum]ALS98242.1 acetyltransferase [Lacimicrobium alkaliphilum]
MSAQFEILNIAPEPEDFMYLRESAGWRNPDLQTVTESIANTLFWVTIWLNKNLVATARIVGDGTMYFYIQDVIVLPSHQGRGLGSLLMCKLEGYLQKQCVPGATVGLLSAFGKESFYEKFGYSIRNGETLGFGMCKFM